jgi:hypothetical protein
MELAMTEDPVIIRLNLRHYRALLDLNLSKEKRRQVEKLIADAEATLQGIASVPCDNPN